MNNLNPTEELPQHGLVICPFCNFDGGYHRKILTGNVYVYDGEGRPMGLGDSYYERGGQKAFCSNCGKDITRYLND